MFQSSRDTTQHEDYESLLSNDQKQSSQRTRTSHPRLRRLALAVIAIACIYTISNIAPSHLPRIKSDRYQEVLAERVELPHIYDGVQTTNAVNSTLGFQKIYALNLPHRLDKKDELTLMGHASDIKIDFLTTQLVADLKDVGLPHHGPVAYPGVIGCWRAHADAWQRIVSNRITSSLIIEDDNDWDVDIKKQFQRMQRPFAHLLKTVSRDDKDRVATSADPWLHQDWDMLFLGYCMEAPPSKDDHPKDVDPETPQHILYDDDTIADRLNSGASITAYMDHYRYPLPGDNSTKVKRVIARAHHPICTNAYAVSLKGAAKLLYYTSRDISSPIDIQMMSLIGSGQLKAFEVMPPLMGQWKMDDGWIKNSDNILSAYGDKYVEEAGAVNHNPSKGRSDNVRNSIRKSLRDILVATE